MVSSEEGSKCFNLRWLFASSAYRGSRSKVSFRSRSLIPCFSQCLSCASCIQRRSTSVSTPPVIFIEADLDTPRSRTLFPRISDRVISQCLAARESLSTGSHAEGSTEELACRLLRILFCREYSSSRACNGTSECASTWPWLPPFFFFFVLVVFTNCGSDEGPNWDTDSRASGARLEAPAPPDDVDARECRLSCSRFR